MQFYELNSSRMDYRELSADDLDLLTPLLRSEETMQTLGGALSYEQTLDWLGDTLRRYQAEGCGWLLALDKPTGVPAALCGLTYEQVGAERMLTANCIVRHQLPADRLLYPCLRRRKTRVSQQGEYGQPDTQAATYRL